jgi:hypothetical protein
MPSRICRFLKNCSPEQRAQYILRAQYLITNPEVLELIRKFDVDKIPELELEFSKFLFTKGTQKDVTDWIVNCGNQRKV